MDVMKIGGKTDNDLVKGVRVAADGTVMAAVEGNVVQEHEWTTVRKLILDNTVNRPTDTSINTVGVAETSSANDRNLIPMKDYALNSLRILNKTGANVQITFLSDDRYTSSQVMRNINNEVISFIVPASTDYFIVTPEDFPLLNYIQYLKFQWQCLSTPNGTDGLLLTLIQRR